MTDSLALHYQQQLALHDVRFEKIEHDDALVAIVYKLTEKNGKQLILKVCPRTPDYLREAYFLKHFETQLPVPKIIHLIPPEAEYPAAVLMECIPGNILKASEFSNSLAEEAGEILARIHLNSTSGYGDLIDPNSLASDPEKSFGLKFDESLMECEGHLPSGLLAQCRHYYQNHCSLLSLADGPCITHRDFRPGNLLAENNHLTGIIDWASARASFAEEDLCYLEHNLWVTAPQSKPSFLRGYAHVRPLPNYLQLMPFLQISKALATIGFLVKQGTWDNQQSNLYRRNREFIDLFEWMK